jgi:hypothetical protein
LVSVEFARVPATDADPVVGTVSLAVLALEFVAMAVDLPAFRVVWAVGFGAVVPALALLRRDDGEMDANADAASRDDRDIDDALSALRERYARRALGGGVRVEADGVAGDGDTGGCQRAATTGANGETGRPADPGTGVEPTVRLRPRDRGILTRRSTRARRWTPRSGRTHIRRASTTCHSRRSVTASDGRSTSR